MGMVLNTNIGAIQAQRALNESRLDMEKAMERLSTGSRINSAADDAAGLAMVERMTTQIRGLTMATRNANDGIALIRTVENALVEVSGMLQRMRELAVQASSDTATASARASANNEFNQLQLEISRVSLNTRYNGAQVLNGSFSAKALQVGTESGETLEFSIGNIEASQIGAFVMEGQNAVAVQGDSATASSHVNAALAAHDVTISAGSLSRVIDVELSDTAKEVAKKINSVAASTQVVAEAKTYAWLHTATASTAVTARLKINGTDTAAFTMTSNDVSDAIAKINLISAATGVQATTTGDYKILLSDTDGDDILVRNISDRNDLKIQSLAIDGKTPFGTQVETVTVGTLANYWDTGTDTVTIADGTTTVTVNLTADPANIDALLTSIQGSTNYGNLGFEVTKKNSTELYYTWKTTGVQSGATYVTNDAASSDESITTSFAGGGVKTLADGSPAAANDTVNVRGNLRLTSNSDFSVTQASADSYFANGVTAAPLVNIGDVDVLTRITASNSLAVLDGAIAIASKMRGGLGTLQNRLEYTVSNLMKVTQFTTGARSRIADADFAAETSRLAKAQVLQQAGAAMLVQANGSTDVILQLIRS
jgi:flagellin